jgi:hypothetical protein
VLPALAKLTAVLLSSLELVSFLQAGKVATADRAINRAAFIVMKFGFMVVVLINYKRGLIVCFSIKTVYRPL